MVSIILFSCADEIDQNQEKTDFEILSEVLNIPEKPFDYSVELPKHISGPFTLDKKEVNNLKITLGRVLFYDTKLSKNNEISCASCHQQALAFSDNVALSEGFLGEVGHRNSLALGNTVGFDLAYGVDDVDAGFGLPSTFFSWDNSVSDLQKQSRLAITSEVEMGMKMNEVVDKLKKEDYYNILFKNAYGELLIEEVTMLDALQAFVNSLSSTSSKFDIAMDSEEHIFPSKYFGRFTISENRGKTLFNDNCASCHSFTHSLTAIPIGNNGLDRNYQDNGKGDKTGLESDKGLFKIPFLRNIALTAPYMHDGRFETLMDVMDHYSHGIQYHKNLSPQLLDDVGNPRKFLFAEQDKNDLIAYMHTLTDNDLVSDEKFSDPFKR